MQKGHRNLGTESGRTDAMQSKGANGMGRFSVDIEIANYADLIRHEMARCRPTKCGARPLAASLTRGRPCWSCRHRS